VKRGGDDVYGCSSLSRFSIPYKWLGNLTIGVRSGEIN
jgi:hypothetical protein